MDRRYITVKPALYKYFMKDKNLQSEMAEPLKFDDKNAKISYKFFDGFKIININGLINLFIIPENPKFEMMRDFIDVTENPLYKVNSILNNSLYFSGVIVEGSDGVGKTTIANSLAKQGIITQDRCMEGISKVMDPAFPKLERLSTVEGFLKNNEDKKVTLIVLSDEEELLNRIYSRSVVNEKDKSTVETQRLYIETYQELKDYPNIYLVDSKNRTPDEMQDIVKSIAFSENTQKEWGPALTQTYSTFQSNAQDLCQ